MTANRWRELDVGDLGEKQYELDFKMTRLRIERDSALLELKSIKERLRVMTIKYLDADGDKVRLKQAIMQALGDMRELKRQLEELAEINRRGMTGG